MSDQSKQGDNMRKHLHFVLCAVAISCAGCAAEKAVTHIDSQPPGARIQVNENMVGTAPCDVTLPQRGEHNRLREREIVKAFPPDGAQGQYKQEKFLVSHQEAPTRILFIMTEPPPAAKP
jgi:hypothetical protein